MDSKQLYTFLGVNFKTGVVGFLIEVFWGNFHPYQRKGPV